MDNKVQGIKTAIKSIEKNRDFAYIKSKLNKTYEFVRKSQKKKRQSL